MAPSKSTPLAMLSPTFFLAPSCSGYFLLVPAAMWSLSPKSTWCRRGNRVSYMLVNNRYYGFLQLIFNISYTIPFPGRTCPIVPCLHIYGCHGLRLCDGAPLCYGALCSPQDSCDYQLTVTYREAMGTPENRSTTHLGFVRLIHWGCISISMITFKRLYN